MKLIGLHGPHLRRPPTEVGLARLRQPKVSKSATADFDGRPSRRMATGRASPVAVLRDADLRSAPQRTVIDLLNRIPVTDGGAGGSLAGRVIPGVATDALYDAIRRFEEKCFPGSTKPKAPCDYATLSRPAKTRAIQHKTTPRSPPGKRGVQAATATALRIASARCGRSCRPSSRT